MQKFDKLLNFLKKYKIFHISLFSLILLTIGLYLVNSYYKKTTIYAIKNFLPSEKIKIEDLDKFNDFPITLEEEIVAKMAPPVIVEESANMQYSPILDDNHNASYLNDN